MRYRIIAALLGLFFLPQGVYAGVIISEVYPAPSDGYEWVELCNNGDEPIHLSSFTLVDAVGKNLYVPPIILEPNQYVIATASSILNNGGDEVTLKNAAVTIQKMTYDSSIGSHQSFVQCADEWIPTDDVTPGFGNPACENILPTSTPKPTFTLSPTLSQNTSSQSSQSSDKSNNASQQDISAQPTHTLLKPSPIDFDLKHSQRSILGVQNTRTPTATTIPTIEPVRVTSTKAIQRNLLGVLFAGLSVAASGYLVYGLAKKIKGAYTDYHDP